ncbi:hypothetical protein D9757_011660 [Collybiopsis confluens]|uniref:Uncharacterized protein n=1 Tax=Collybiopsis confluens TaxID=2823264 RepID=A0A8H5GHX4_9AGAR|nr:hypothetical protein D9757_011660 [Collybiopsis confluens]
MCDDPQPKRASVKPSSWTVWMTRRQASCLSAPTAVALQNLATNDPENPCAPAFRSPLSGLLSHPPTFYLTVHLSLRIPVSFWGSQNRFNHPKNAVSIIQAQHLAMSGEVSSLPLSGYLDLNLCFGWGDDSGHLNYQDFLSKMILGLDDEIVVDWNPGNTALPINIDISSPCSTHILGTKLAVHPNPPSAPLQQPPCECCHPFSMLHPYLGNEADCLHESSIRSPATTLPVNVVIPPPWSRTGCPRKSSICSAAAALTVNVAIPFHTPSWEPSWLSTRFLHLFLLSGSPSN